MIQFSNNASTQLITILTPDATELHVDSTNGFPVLKEDDYCILCIQSITNFEIVKCTSKTADTFTVERGYEGTIPSLFNVGSQVELRLTAESLNHLVQDSQITYPHTSEDRSQFGNATGQLYSHVRLTDDFEDNDTSYYGVACSPFAVREAILRIQNILEKTIITESTTWTVPETGKYEITCIGGGGNGGAPGNYVRNVKLTSQSDGYGGRVYTCLFRFACGGGGGGGGAGQVITQTLNLVKGRVIPITIGAAGGGNTSFGEYITALGGGNGANGGNASANQYVSTIAVSGIGGAAGVSYNGAATAGATGQVSNIISVDNGASSSCPYSRAGNAGPYWGGDGGIGRASLDGLYGNGGNGGKGGGYWQKPADNWYAGNRGLSYPTSGTPGAVYIQSVASNN